MAAKNAFKNMGTTYKIKKNKYSWKKNLIR